MTLAGFRNSVVSSTTGLPVSGAIVTVTLAGTSTPATIYEDKNAVTEITYLATDADGFFEFYAVAGTYDVMVSLGASSVVWNDIAIGTMQATDYTRVWRLGSAEVEDLDVAISNALPVVQTAAEWAADDETILVSGRIGLESDTGKFKFGNGVHLWSTLSYAVGEVDDPLPEGTQSIVTKDSTGATVLSETAGDGSIVIDADGLVTAVPKFPSDETEFLDVDASRDLAATDAFDRIYTPTGQASRKKHTILKVEATDPNDAVALNVANNCPTLAAVLVVVTGDQVGAVTLTVGGAGTINGGTDPVTILPERPFAIMVENPTLTAPIVRTSATMEDGGIETVSASGVLTFAAHNGRKVLTTGNVTVPNTPTFWCIIKAGGAHTVTHNSLTSAAMSTGDEIVVLIGPSDVIDAWPLSNANRVAFS